MSEKDIRKKVINYNFKLFDKKIIKYLVKNQKSLRYIDQCIKKRFVSGINSQTIKGRDEVIIQLKKNFGF